jgi:hypothetical protein
VRLPEHVVRSSVCPAEIRADQNTAREPQLLQMVIDCSEVVVVEFPFESCEETLEAIGLERHGMLWSAFSPTVAFGYAAGWTALSLVTSGGLHARA